MERVPRRGCGCCEHCQCLGFCVSRSNLPPLDTSPNALQLQLPLQQTNSSNTSPRRGAGEDLLEKLQRGVHPHDLIGKSNTAAAAGGQQQQQQQQVQQQQQQQPPTSFGSLTVTSRHDEDGRVSKEIPARPKGIAAWEEETRSHSRQQYRRHERRPSETGPNMEAPFSASSPTVEDRTLLAPRRSGGGTRSRQASDDNLHLVVGEALSRGRSIKEQVTRRVDRKLEEGVQIGGYTLSRTKSATAEDQIGLSAPIPRARSASRQRQRQGSTTEREDAQKQAEVIEEMRRRQERQEKMASRRITRDDLLQALRKTAAEREREEERERQKEMEEELRRLHDRRMVAAAEQHQHQQHQQRQQLEKEQQRRLYLQQQQQQQQQQPIGNSTLFVSHLKETNSCTILFARSEGEMGTVAYRLVGAAQYGDNKGEDWVLNSLEKGTKVKGKLYLGLGRNGPVLYELEPRRKSGVDGWLIKGAKGYEDKFATRTHYGDHDDYKNLYFRSPQGKAYKWFTDVQAQSKVMRVFGRSSDEHGTLFAQATFNVSSNAASHHKKRHHHNHSQHQLHANGGQGGGDSAILTCLLPTSPSLTNGGALAGKSTSLDEALVCATWWCARQTWDESRVVEAHKEVRLIEEIEKAFEVDLLGAA